MNWKIFGDVHMGLDEKEKKKDNYGSEKNTNNNTKILLIQKISDLYKISNKILSDISLRKVRLFLYSFLSSFTFKIAT